MKLLNKIKITLIIAFCIIIFSSLKAFAVTGTITEITVNMRKEPSTTSKRLMFVTQDYKVEVLEKVGEWYKIKYNGVTGYVYGKYVDVDDSKLEAKEPEVEKPKQEETTNKNEDTNNTQKEDEKKPIQDVTTDVQVELQIKENVTLRLIPNITSSVIYTSTKALSVDVIEQFGDWSYVYVDGIYGWVRTDNIAEKNSEAINNNKDDDKEIEYVERTVAYIKYSSVNLRKKASTSSTVLAKLKLNNEVIVLEEVDVKWSKVEYDGITGYVSTDLLSSEKVDEKEESTSTSRDGETVSRDEMVEDKKEETTKQEETTTNKDTNVKEDTSNKGQEKETTNKKEDKKEETNNEVEEKQETSKDTEIKKEDETKKEEKPSKSETTTTSKTKAEEIVEYAKKYLGYDYVLGGSTPKSGFDCSGFTSYVYKQFGYTLSRTSTAQAKNGREVAKSDLQPGDLLIFKNQALTKIGHVGIYIGNNKMIHASEPGIGVVITDLDARGYNYNKRYVTARRIVE